MKTVLGVLSSAVLAASGATAQAETAVAQMIVRDRDNYHVTFVKDRIAGGQFGNTFSISEVITPEPNKVAYVPGSKSCSSSSTCSFVFRINKKGPVDLSPWGFVGPIAYGYAELVDEVANTAAIDTNLWTSFHIAEVLTRPSLDPNYPGNFYIGGQAESTKIGETADYIEVRTLIGLQLMTGTAAREYQNLNFLISGVLPDPNVLDVFDRKPLGEGYVQASGDRGVISGFQYGNDYRLLVRDWQIAPQGHFAALSFFTNGTSATDPGRNLSDYKRLEVRMSCSSGLLVEAFMGSPHEAQHHFLSDLSCNGQYNTYQWDITAMNRDALQAALWLHVPLWKNGGFAANDFKLDVVSVKLSK